MTDTAIRVENLGKRYKLGAAKSGSFRESMSKLFQRNGSLSHPESNPTPNTPSHPESNPTPNAFWALQDINFEIKRGEAVGIIGRNGAGKSTLLKILSRITEPTRGRYEIFGRVSSLLEVGTGFHPELTGRENVYLNGTILGMKRREVKAKFDEIVAFSGVEKFIDTPVKHYSSGMQVRLAFAVAAHLEPEILIIDEVLAVGDAEFQKKCLGKMEDVTGEGRTVLFVSHNMGAVETLCNRGIVLTQGVISTDSAADEAVKCYLSRSRANQADTHIIDLGRHINKKHRQGYGLYEAEILVNGYPSTSFSSGDDVLMKFRYRVERQMVNPILGLVIKSPTDEPFIGINNRHTAQKLSSKSCEGTITVTIPNIAIYGSGQCGVDLYFGDNEDNSDIIKDAFHLDMKASDMLGTGVFVNTAINKVYQPHVSFSLERESAPLHPY